MNKSHPDTISPEGRALLVEGVPLMALDGLLDPGVDAALEDAHEIPDKWMSRFPRLIQDAATKLTSAAEARVFALAALVAVSIALPNVVFFYRSRRYEPALFFNAVGPAASGKAAVNFALRLLDRVSVTFGDGEPVVSGDGESRRPKLLLGADASAAGIVGQLAANGGRGIFESTELDSIAGAKANQWGHIDPLFRKAAEHERIDVLRKGGSVTVPRPVVAAILAGTFGQFPTMFETPENGLLSRFSFHVLTEEREWDSGDPSGGGGEIYDALRAGSETVGALFDALRGREEPVVLQMAQTEWDLFDSVFRTLFDWAKAVEAGDPFLAVVLRGAVMAQRYAAVVHALEVWGTRPPDGDRDTLSRDAVVLGIYLALHHADHALRLLAILPGQRTPVQGALKRALRLLKELPDEFTRFEAVGVGDGQSTAPRTVDSYLLKLRQEGYLREGDGMGRYVKTPKGGGRSRWGDDYGRDEIITE